MQRLLMIEKPNVDRSLDATLAREDEAVEAALDCRTCR